MSHRVTLSRMVKTLTGRVAVNSRASKHAPCSTSFAAEAKGEAWLPDNRGPSWRYRASVNSLDIRRELQASEGDTIFPPERAAHLLSS